MFTRRLFLKACSVRASLVAAVAPCAAVQAVEPYGSRDEADAWIRKLMSDRFDLTTNPLWVGRFADRMYYVLKECGWRPNPGQEQYRPVDVPKGFVTDFASIPRIFWTILPPDDRYTYAAVLHDYLYWTQTTSRADADLVFKFAMEDHKVNAITIEAIYLGVRAGGGGAWDENAKLKAAGERRILRRYPTKATTNWKDFKLETGVF